jgi:hypothetical protein
VGQFALDISRFVEKTRARQDVVVRKIALEILTRVVMRSPVGNPELWAANASAVRVNTAVRGYNTRLRERASNLDKRGRLRRGLKMTAIQGGQNVARLTLPAGRGYVGGRFRGNWNVSIGMPDTITTEAVDPRGSQTISRGSAVLAGYAPGSTIYISNSLPYAYRIEFESWSKQAPAGVVRVTVAEYAAVVRQAVEETPQ